MDPKIVWIIAIAAGLLIGYLVVMRVFFRESKDLDKKIDFGQALFGGPSSADLLAPSFIGTWMRVQQDFWAAYATGWQRRDDASHFS